MPEDVKLDAELLKGNPAENLVVDPPKEDEVIVDKEDAPLYEGFTGALKTQEELVGYTKSLEEKLLQSQMANKNPANNPIVPPVVVPQVKEDDIDDLWYSNPKAAEQKIINKTLAAVDKRDEAKRQKESFWKEFYIEHPDLQRRADVVDLIVSAKMTEFAEQSLPDAKKNIAKKAREMISKINKDFGVSEKELGSGGASMLGASGEPAPKGETPPKKPMNLTEQLASLKRKQKAS